MVETQLLIQSFVFGLVTGTILTLPAVGKTIQYSIIKSPNFAAGDFMTVGAYVTLFFNISGLDIISSAILGCILMLLFGTICEFFLFRPLSRRGGKISIILATIGLGFVMQNIVYMTWTSRPYAYQVPIQRALRWYEIRITRNEIFLMLISLLLVFLFSYFLKRTKIGKAMRATADNRDLAQVVGVNTDTISAYSWMFFSLFACFGGVFLGLESQLSPTMGRTLLTAIFAAIFIGRIGSVKGAMIGAFVVGMAMEVASVAIDPVYKTAVAFVIMVVAFVVRLRREKQ